MEMEFLSASALYDSMRKSGQRRAPEAMKAKHVGERLRAIRIANNMKQNEIAALLEIDPVYWSRWERGHRPIPNPEAHRLTQFFDVDMDYILTGSLKSVPPVFQVALREAANRPPED